MRMSCLCVCTIYMTKSKVFVWRALAVVVLLTVVLVFLLFRQGSSSADTPETSKYTPVIEADHTTNPNNVMGQMLHTQTQQTGRPLTEHLSQSDMDGVETFLIFIGWPRSCHSIIGSMLDAHPNMIVAHEYFLFLKLREDKRLSLNRSQLYEELYRNSQESVKDKGLRNSDHNKKGYSLNIDGSWQGRFTELKVIGDKSGGRAVLEYMKDSHEFKKLYQQLTITVKVPIKALQVIRNPLDMIATATLYRGSSVHGAKAKATPAHKYSNLKILRRSASSVLAITDAIMRTIPDVGLSPLEVHCEDLITDPAKTISDICRFLDLECSPDYLQMCVDKTFKNVSESRHLVYWDPLTTPSLTKKLSSFPFFQIYFEMVV